MKFKELNILHKYLYNRVGYDEFSKALKYIIPSCDDRYIQEKWSIFQKNQLQFIASFDEKLFNYFIKQIDETNYKG